MRHKNQMVNGGGPPSLPHCVSFPTPPPHSQVTYLPHGHFSALRPSSGIYSNYSHGPYARPAYPSTYQPNGEMMYQYPGHPASGGTPPPPPNAAGTPAPYMPPTPVVTYAPVAVQPTKVSCYNCGSSNHIAIDCKDQTMEDLTKKAQYRLDYTIMKQPGDCSNSDKWSPAMDHPIIHHHQLYHSECRRRHYHHHCHYHNDPASTNRHKDRPNDDCYYSSCKLSVIFLDILCIEADEFLTEDISRFTVPGILFTSSYLW